MRSMIWMLLVMAAWTILAVSMNDPGPSMWGWFMVIVTMVGCMVGVTLLFLIILVIVLKLTGKL